MVSRRRVLQSGGAVFLTALAGCQASGDSPRTDEPNEKPTTSAPTNTTTPDEPTLSVTMVEASEVPSGSTVAVTTLALRALVADAATTDGRVDLDGNWDASGNEPLALGQFDYLRFDGETYDPTATHAGFAQEASFTYMLAAVNESEVDGDVLQYAALNESERAIVDEMVTNGSYGVGHHEEKPDAIAPVEQHQYLRAENETYRIQKIVGDSAAHHMLRLDPANPGDGEQVVTVVDRPAPSSFRETVMTAIANGSAAVPDWKGGAAYLDGVDYILTTTAVASVELAGTA